MSNLSVVYGMIFLGPFVFLRICFFSLHFSGFGAIGGLNFSRCSSMSAEFGSLLVRIFGNFLPISLLMFCTI